MDAIDEQLVGLLLADGRATYAELGEAVGLSAPAAKRRVDRLRERGVVRGFTAVVDPTVLGWGTEAYVAVFCRGNVAPGELKRALAAVPEIISAATVSGAADAVAHVRAADMQHLERAIERLRDLPQVDRTESTIVLSRLVERGSG